MARTTLAPPNAILFVLDPTHANVVVPTPIDEALISATESCIACGVQPDVDGETEVSLVVDSADQASTTGLCLEFTGVLATPGGQIAVVTSHNQIVLTADILAASAEVSISVDDLRWPSRLLVTAKPRLHS